MAPLLWLVALVFPVESSVFTIFHHLSQPINCKHLHARESYDTHSHLNMNDVSDTFTPRYIVPLVTHTFCSHKRKQSLPRMRSRSHHDFHSASSFTRQRHWHPLRINSFTRRPMRMKLAQAPRKQSDCTSNKPPSYQSNHVFQTDSMIPKLPESSSSSKLTSGVIAPRYKGTAQVSKFIDDEIETLSST